jgi:hypothetical protein
MQPDFSVFITPEWWMVAAACGAVAIAVKAIPKLPSWLIPLLNVVLGSVGYSLLLGEFSGFNILSGVLAGSVSMIVYEFFYTFIGGIINSFSSSTKSDSGVVAASTNTVDITGMGASPDGGEL